LKPLHERAQKLARGIGSFAIEHVPREQNSEADALANRALDETARSGSSRSDAAPLRAPAAAPAAKLDIAPSSTATAPDGAASKTTIRARYSAGALHPLGALDLDEGEIVEIAIKKSGRD
jgi:hypothetical protein